MEIVHFIAFAAVIAAANAAAIFLKRLKGLEETGGGKNAAKARKRALTRARNTGLIAAALAVAAAFAAGVAVTKPLNFGFSSPTPHTLERVSPPRGFGD